MKIGFVGLGVMGTPMCTNIVKKSNNEVYVYDLNQDAVKNLENNGAIALSSSAEISKVCDVIITMVPKTEHVEAVYNEFIENVRENQIYIDMSTISPSVSKSVANKIIAKGAEMIDAPVVKSQAAAVNGVLGIYVGGSEKTLNKVKDILLMMGNNIIHLGDNGSGLIMKLCHNTLVAQIQNGVNETYTLARKSMNLSMETFAEAISYGGGQNFYLDSKSVSIGTNDFTTAFSVENMNKDVHLTKELCKNLDLNLDGVDLSVKRYENAMNENLNKMDFSATIKLFEE